MTHKILVVEDDPAHARMLKTLISDWGYEVAVADDGDTGVEQVTSRSFDVVLLDMKMKRMSGMEALSGILAYNPALPVVMMTAYSSVDTAVEALKAGAYDYLTKPLDFDRLKLTIERILERIFLQSENRQLKERLKSDSLRHNILGKSPAMTALLDTLDMVAPTDANVLVTGESGTGKELVAAALHENSPRKGQPFVRINCAAITPTLLESELFGHARGAFTGADTKRKGRFLQAHKGSILLDEIGEMSLPMQAKLLRVLQEKEITPVGSDDTIPVDVRVIAATNRDLKTMAEQGTFRQDLFFRLNVVTVTIPPLRERAEDIPELVLHFLTRFSEKNRREIKGVAPDAMDAMIRYAWPGNVRELMNAVERAVVLARTDYITRGDLPFGRGDDGSETEGGPGPADVFGLEGGPGKGGLENRPLSRIEKEAILSTLAAADGNKSETARRLGITRKTLLNKLRQYGKDD